uniref:Putative secreted protein n=1 Tax=Anopheles darlingi TaxID=43151 RepID=A0A2M4DN36_ANODA
MIAKTAASEMSVVWILARAKLAASCCPRQSGAHSITTTSIGRVSAAFLRNFSTAREYPIVMISSAE